MSFAFWFVTMVAAFGVGVAYELIDDPTAFAVTLLWAMIAIALIGTIDIWTRRN